MNAHDYLNDDGRAVLVLCSAFGMSREMTDEGLAPLTLREWNELAGKVRESALKQPAALRGLNADELASALALPPGEAERIARLLGRSDSLATDLEKIFEGDLWAVTRVDEAYPAHLRDVLRHQAPTVLFGAGDIRLLRRPGVAVVGSRNIDEAGAAFARDLGSRCAAAGVPVVSGGARGTDRLAMQGALDAGGTAFGVLADSLERTARQADVRQFVGDGKLVLLTPYAPTAGFSVGAAMGRNKLIYGLAEFAVVVSSDFQTGGTWAGAVEALKAGWCPVFARDGEGVPKGNRELLKLGATPLPADELPKITDVAAWMKERATPKPVEKDLFDFALREGPK